MPRRRSYSPPVYYDGENMIVSLDGDTPVVTRPDGSRGRVYNNSYSYEGKLRFSVKRGKVSLASKIKATPQFEAREVLDEEGNRCPNPKHEEEKKRWGHTYQPEHLMENALLEEPKVEIEYERDYRWIEENGRTLITL